MTLTRRARDLVIVAILLALPVLALRASGKAPTETNAFERVLLRVMSPVQRLFGGIGGSIGSLWTRYVALIHVKENNVYLAAENAKLRAEVSRLEAMGARTQALEGLLDLRAQVPSETMAAHVVAVETSPFFRVLRVRLDRGDGQVKAGMPVLVPGGVVGRVARVYGAYSDVLLATDAKSAIDVVVPRTGGRGVVKGIVGDRNYHVRVEYFKRDDEVAVGDSVVTSGIGAFPRDVLVGRVTSVKRGESGLYQDVELAPAVDFSKLNEVLVVLSAPPPADPDAGKRFDPVRGLGAPR